MADQPKPRILIVEDYDAISVTYELLLSPFFDVTFYEKSNAVADDIATGKLDLSAMEAAVVDQKLGHGQLSGIDLLSELKKTEPSLEVVLATAFEQMNLDSGPNAFRFVVKKGDFVTYLIEHIRECIVQTRLNRRHG